MNLAPKPYPEIVPLRGAIAMQPCAVCGSLTYGRWGSQPCLDADRGPEAA